MNSNMLAGERRWASARRGGMTVLGKVAVPKPLNLPSQRLENHGLDPNVDIVPKGTLGWGSRPSSSGSNPWVSSSPSPNAEGGTSSPSHLGGRPSSGGSGTRPSTAGSERSHEPGAWGSNSRPSSASGTLSSNQTSSTSLRPRSADNIPNSSQSQLSRFADPVPKNSAAWTPDVTAQRLGVKSSKEEGFSLTSGDFPTLGTEKDNSMTVTELEDHGRPSSASGRIAHGKKEARSQSDAKHGTVNTWRADGPQGPDDDIHPSMEKSHGDNPPQYFNPNASSQHFDAWRGPPMNSPSGVWYGGRPRGPPPFGASVGHGGFPMEPFPYYRPQIAPPPLVGSQPGLTPGPRGSHPKNGDLYRLQMPDAAYARPGVQFRPSFYPGQPGPIAFESFYGPPMGYERDIPYMVAPPLVYNSTYPGSAPDSRGRDGRGHHAGITSSEQVEAKDTQGPKRVTLKSRNQCDQWEEGETREHNLQQPDVYYPEKKCLPMISSIKNEWGVEVDPKEAVCAKKRTTNEKAARGYENRAHSMDGVKVKSFEGIGNAKADNDSWTNVSDCVPSLPVEMPRVPLGSGTDPSLPAMTKKSALMQKIDGLNVKTHVSDERNDSPGAYNREEVRKMSQTIYAKVTNSTAEVSNTVRSFERTTASRDVVSVPHEVSVPVGNKPIQPMIAVSRRSHHGGQGRVDHRGKGKFSSQDADGWRKKPLTTESSSVIMASHGESPPSSRAHGPDKVEVDSENSVINPVVKVVGGSVETHDSVDIQQAKTREIAKQRALQLQKEEEERTKEQRAKALAKLEELNRQTLAGEAGTEKAEKSQIINDIQGEHDESRTADGLSMTDHNHTNQAEAVEMPINLPVVSDVSTSLPVQEDARDDIVKKSAPQYNDSRHKRAGYKQKQNNSLQKSFTEKVVCNVAANSYITSGEHYPSSESIPSESNLPNTSDIVVKRFVSQRRKSNRGSKNKQRPDETPLPPVESCANPVKETIENIGAKDFSPVSTVIEPEPNKAVKAQEVICSSLPNEESHSSRVSNQWSSHPSRRQPRSQQVNNKPHGSGDTAVWAPVNKAKVSVEASPDSVLELTSSTKGYNNSLNGKRAEMERYVPMPVAKELAQQVYAPNVSVTSSKSNDGSSGEVNDRDIISHNKHRKDQGTWKQQGLSHSSHVKGAHVESQSEKNDFDKAAEIRSSGPADGYTNIITNNTNTAKFPPVKDQRATSRGKRNLSKGTASTGDNNNDTDHNKSFRNEAEANQVDRSIGSKENRTSHWQPKSSGSSTASNQHGNRTESLTTEVSRFSRKEHKAQGVSFNQTQQGQSVDVKNNVAQEFEKKSKGHPYSPNQYPVVPGELPHQDVHLDRNFPSGSRKNNRQNNRLVRGHESREDWALGHDNLPVNAPPFRDNRQGQNPQYEYQPVGPFKGNMPRRDEEPNDGADSMGLKHREKRPPARRWEF